MSSDSDPSAFSHQPLAIERRQRPRPIERVVALLEVLLCSDYPTQLALGTTFALFGFRPSATGRMSLGYIAALSLTDTVLLIGLIVFFLRAHGERDARGAEALAPRSRGTRDG